MKFNTTSNKVLKVKNKIVLSKLSADAVNQNAIRTSANAYTDNSSRSSKYTVVVQSATKSELMVLALPAMKMETWEKAFVDQYKQENVIASLIENVNCT